PDDLAHEIDAGYAQLGDGSRGRAVVRDGRRPARALVRRPVDPLKLICQIPALIPVLVRMFSEAQARWEARCAPALRKPDRTWAARDLANTPAADMLEGAREIVQAAADTT